MKKYFLLLALLMGGCTASVNEDRAHKAAQGYIKGIYDDPHLQPVAFSEVIKKRYTTPLDSALNYAHIDPEDHDRMKKYVDSENAQRPDLSASNTKNMDDIEHGRLTYYTMIYSFRIDSGNHKKLIRYQFELDTGYRVLKATDITDVRGRVE